MPGEKQDESKNEKDEAEKKDENGQNDTEEGSPRNGRKKQKEYFKEELKRLKEGLKKQSAKIKAPPMREHFPDVFNDLEPYYNTGIAKYLIEEDEVSPMSHRSEDARGGMRGYMVRPTATGLVDPWHDLHMDEQMVALPKIQHKPVINTEKKKRRSNEKRPPKEGSTRLPIFPTVRLEGQDLARELTYKDVPSLREELRRSYSTNAKRKIDEDYTRTMQDFYRMDLDRLHEIHPKSRPHMVSAYYAYLQNTVGSKKAVYKCLGLLENAEHDDETKADETKADESKADNSGVDEQQQQEVAAQ